MKFGRVIKVYDGDTITIAAKLPYPQSPWYRFQVRLVGIDTPEMRPKKDVKNRESEMRTAVIAKTMLKDRIFKKVVELRNTAKDKYGRILADVIHDGVNMSQWLIKLRLAVKYDGGTKKPPVDWL